MAAVGQGNLSIHLDVKENGRGEDDPLLILAEQLNETTSSLRTMIEQIRGAASALNAQAAEILSTIRWRSSGESTESTRLWVLASCAFVNHAFSCTSCWAQ